jgi:hexokinase
MVARRAALLSGVAVATVLIQTGRAVFPGQKGKPTKNEPKIGVGVDGRSVVS